MIAKAPKVRCWNGPGNACNGYGLTFLQLGKDGSASLSDDIGWCGGPEPSISRTGARITVTIPQHRPNRGTGELPAATWTYEAGVVAKQP